MLAGVPDDGGVGLGHIHQSDGGELLRGRERRSELPIRLDRPHEVEDVVHEEGKPQETPLNPQLPESFFQLPELSSEDDVFGDAGLADGDGEADLGLLTRSGGVEGDLPSVLTRTWSNDEDRVSALESSGQFLDWLVHSSFDELNSRRGLLSESLPQRIRISRPSENSIESGILFGH